MLSDSATTYASSHVCSHYPIGGNKATRICNAGIATSVSSSIMILFLLVLNMQRPCLISPVSDLTHSVTYKGVKNLALHLLLGVFNINKVTGTIKSNFLIVECRNICILAKSAEHYTATYHIQYTEHHEVCLSLSGLL